MTLILFGGVQGVGKTTLLSWLEHRFAERITLLDPGELFRRYFYNEKLKTVEEIEELIVSTLEKVPHDAVVVVHWHYAVRRPSGYIPQISFPRLKRLASRGKIDQVVLLVVEVPVDVIYERRIMDFSSKKRALVRSVIHEEIATDETFLMRYQDAFSKALGDHRVLIFRVPNTNLEKAKHVLRKFFDSLLK